MKPEMIDIEPTWLQVLEILKMNTKILDHIDMLKPALQIATDVRKAQKEGMHSISFVFCADKKYAETVVRPRPDVDRDEVLRIHGRARLHGSSFHVNLTEAMLVADRANLDMLLVAFPNILELFGDEGKWAK